MQSDLIAIGKNHKTSCAGSTTENKTVIALAGNPNVGKSTVFNGLTGLKQHTGNWAGKTVSNALGQFRQNGNNYTLVDLPGTYSILSHSHEEKIARDYICFGEADAVVVVCDATCLERNLILVLQILEITPNVVLCINLIDEANRKKIIIDTDLLSRLLDIPVVCTNARKGIGTHELIENAHKIVKNERTQQQYVSYPNAIETQIQNIREILNTIPLKKLDSRWLAVKLIENNPELLNSAYEYLGCNLAQNPELKSALDAARDQLSDKGFDNDIINDTVVASFVLCAEQICSKCVQSPKGYDRTDRKIDKILTGKKTAFPIMALGLLVVFYITINGANYPSQVLSDLLFSAEIPFYNFLTYLKFPDFISRMLIFGVYRVLAWIVSVMLPPMAIFFPLFTLLEDSGFLPRIAYNLDKYFKKCNACGKQALTMCMGFGCNAVGITGCRIIDSPRERLIAILTNNLVPCNGRFPALISVITIFFIGTTPHLTDSLYCAVILTAVILLGIALTFLSSKLLSHTVLKGIPSSFTLELPPYRKPQILKIITRSIFDRTLFVLGRAVMVAAPAGLFIWLLANTYISGVALIDYCVNILDPLGRLLGLDGVILLAFILGFPANEIVIPIAIMCYLSNGTLSDISNLAALKTLLIDNGWTLTTAISFMLFSLCHWPCSTTCLTIKKETGSLKWTLLAMALPTIEGVVLCLVFNFVTSFL
ncbi:MAG: ferrous iron transport protein B [bacterium]|nr:ferrous iron transport protein B [bacterium]